MDRLVVNTLLTWRLTNLCIKEDGPFEMFALFRDAVGVDTDEFSKCIGRNQFALAFCCFWCASVWVGVAVAIAARENPLKGLAYSAGAILVERFRLK